MKKNVMRNMFRSLKLQHHQSNITKCVCVYEFKEMHEIFIHNYVHVG